MNRTYGTDQMTYQIIDKQTGRIVGTYNNRIRARTRRDRLDNEYGAYRYIVKAVAL